MRTIARAPSLPLPAVIVVATAIAALACGDPYQHTNPYDPVVPVTVEVSGPDTLFSFNEVGHFSAQALPAFPDSAFQFASSDSVVLAPSGRSDFTSKEPPLYPLTRRVTVSALLGQIDTIADDTKLSPGVTVPAVPSLAWRHSGAKFVVLTQRVVRIQIRCPETHDCDALFAGGSWTVWADGRDSLGYLVAGLNGINANPPVSSSAPVFATFAVRDTSVATFSPVGIRVASVTAKRSGSTWIVATRGALADSSQLIVH